MATSNHILPFCFPFYFIFQLNYILVSYLDWNGKGIGISWSLRSFRCSLLFNKGSRILWIRHCFSHYLKENLSARYQPLWREQLVRPILSASSENVVSMAMIWSGKDSGNYSSLISKTVFKSWVVALIF